ncbi:glycine cleavage system protein GcvH [Stratiformator vulcanicus]|uniref:Glycine cleavage system H protein n=1 Tax=Stratiformator vulcanicus TaxID=2527980 RepID=A0A517R3A3_9PLAN|nr:glycine cleavage system protein GcvH [Stratiformator vulcanicus]QDT38317.1 Glycine cleavage system H protein [Stratiformator vulcanicus]
MNPDQLKYLESHEWVGIDGDIATVGISEFAVNQLTDLVYAELPNVGETVKKGDTFGEVESVKAVSDLYAPVSGEVTEVNSDLADDLTALTEDAFGKGWMIKVKLSDPSELDSLMDRSAYVAHCEND